MSYRRSQDVSNSGLLTVKNNIVGIAPGVTDPFMLGSSPTLASTQHQQAGDFVTTEAIRIPFAKKPPLKIDTIKEFDDSVNEILSRWMLEYCTKYEIDMKMTKYTVGDTVTYQGDIDNQYKQDVKHITISRDVKEKITENSMLFDNPPMKDGWGKLKIMDKGKTMKKKFEFKIFLNPGKNSLQISISPASSKQAYGNQSVPPFDFQKKYERCFDNFRLRVKVLYGMSIKSGEKGEYTVYKGLKTNDEQYYREALGEVVRLFGEACEKIGETKVPRENINDIAGTRVVRLISIGTSKIFSFAPENDGIKIYT